MASVINVSINLDKISREKIVIGEKGKYLNLTVTVENEPDKYGNDGAVYIGQNKQERDSKAPKIFLGNSKVVWSDGKVNKPSWGDNKKPASKNKNKPAEEEEDDLPF